MVSSENLLHQCKEDKNLVNYNKKVNNLYRKNENFTNKVLIMMVYMIA